MLKDTRETDTVYILQKGDICLFIAKKMKINNAKRQVKSCKDITHYYLKGDVLSLVFE